LNRHASRYSKDIDVFHDREERLAMTALADVTALKDAGYQVRWLRQLPLIYAAVEKAPGFTPEGLIAEIRRNANYPAADWRALLTSDPIDSVDVVSRLRAALEEADMFVAKMPTGKAGLLFLEAGRVVQPDPERLAHYQTHAGRRQGHWPGNTKSPPQCSSTTGNIRRAALT
jgi:hypothetical protein